MHTIEITSHISVIEAFLTSKQESCALPLASAGIQHTHVHCGFCLKEDNEIKGVAVLYATPLEYHGMPTWVLGNFEWPNDHSSFAQLVALAKKECRQNGIKQLAGPMNGSTWNTYRFRIETPDAKPLFLTEKYQETYYPGLWNNAFDDTLGYFSAIDYRLLTDQPDFQNTKERLLKNGLTLRPLDTSNLENELRRLHAFNHIAFQTNQFYSPIEDNSFVAKYLDAQKLISPDYVKLAEDAQGNIVGFIFAFPDLMYGEGKRLVVKTLARHPDAMWRGLGFFLLAEVFAKAKSQGFTSAIHAFMAQNGTSAPVSDNLGSAEYAHYKLYITRT